MAEVREQVREHLPEASDDEVERQLGDFTAARLARDVEAALADGVVTEEEASTLRDDSIDVDQQGVDEDTRQVPLEENPITVVARQGHADLLLAGAEEIRQEDSHRGVQAAELIGRAEERSHLPLVVPTPRWQQQPRQQHFSGQREGSHDGLSPENQRTVEYMRECEATYPERLRSLLVDGLARLPDDARKLGTENEVVRYELARALTALGADAEALGFGVAGDKHAYEVQHPEVATRAARLAADARLANPYLQAKAGEVARDANLILQPAEAKDENRIAEKMELDYQSLRPKHALDVEQLAAKVKDAVRCRLIIRDDPTSVDDGIIEEIAEHGLTIAHDHTGAPRIKQSYRDRRTNEPIQIEDATNYRDTKVTVTVEVPTTDGRSVLGEIAIVTPDLTSTCSLGLGVFVLVRGLR
ncbi:hypothetical protein [Salana multivorans]